MNEAELAARYEDATWHCEHHNPDLNYVGKYALSEVPTDLGFKVVLTGMSQLIQLVPVSWSSLVHRLTMIDDFRTKH